MASYGIRTQQDLDRVRQQYLDNLAYQDRLFQANLDSNVIYQKTGQIPKEVDDTRSAQEKLADMLKLKQDLLKGLTKLTDPQAAGTILSQLTDDEVVFAAQQLGSIIADLSTKFKYGIIPEDFLVYLRRLIDKFNITRGVDIGLQQGTGDQILLTNNQILTQMLNRADLATLETKLDDLPKTNRFILHRITQLKDDIQEMKTVIPTEANLEQIARLATAERADMMEALTENLRQLPSKRDLMRYIAELDIALRNGTPADLVSIMERLHNILDIDIQGIPVARALFAAAPQAAAAATAGPAIIAAPQAVTAYVKATPDPSNYTEYAAMTSINNKKKFLLDLIANGNLDVNQITNSSKHGLAPNLANLAGNDSQSKKAIVKIGETNIDKLVEAHFKRIDAEIAAQVQAGKLLSPAAKATATGVSGLSKRINYVDKFSKQMDAPVKKTIASYTPFGNLAINKARLGDDVLMLRFPCGAGMPDYPTQKISSALSKCMQYILQTGQADFDCVNDLDDDDRTLLYKLLKRSKLSETVSVPKIKTKNRAERDFDRFNILKGQVLAGNDNPQIAKELKLLIVKLMNSREIPRREALSVLVELGAMGI